MLIKWIECKVPVEDTGRFSGAQESWRRLCRVEGFVGQLGGWDTLEPDTACILGLWRSLDAYESFMAGPHDRIVAGSGQRECYRSVAVSLFHSDFRPEGGIALLGKVIRACTAVGVRWHEDAPGGRRSHGAPGPNGGSEPLAVLRGDPIEGSGPRVSLFLWRVSSASHAFDRVVTCEPGWTVVTS
jgi:hypothetical protein